MINEYDDSADNFATFLMNYNDDDDVFYDDCFKPNVLLQWQNISSEFCRQPVTQPREDSLEARNQLIHSGSSLNAFVQDISLLLDLVGSNKGEYI